MLEQETAYYRSLDKDWVATLEEIRRLDGFGDFLRPDSFATLQRAAANGPVVILNASEHGCDALVMTLSAVEHVPLPKFTMKLSRMLIKLIQSASGARNFPVAQLQALVQETRSLLEPPHRDDRGIKFVNTTPDDIFRRVLATLWTSVAAPIIRSLALTKSESPPRLWWCPTGVFTFLPIHAAGLYDVQDGERVSDYIVSSYTPTLSSRIVSLPPASDSFKIMAVIQPHVRGYSSLPCTRDELERIEKHVPQKCLVTLGIPEAPATVENVLSHLSTVSIVHFACHGVQDAKRPLESALVLEDGEKLKISRIMEQPMPNASLAFLSACQTAMGDENLPDEAIHLAASLLFSGFHGAVATMWSMQDDDGPKIADSFYGNLFKTHESPITDISHPYPDGTPAARALHLAVAKLRDEKCSFKRWVPFIHLGM
ncbi:hypothetical protein PILCRDRAFT_681181 [Piloderma croceum F 1598]|uniref:CHAT domain-containing protein n=1 Tax=Piloderma croceum (strain F 1598) TaxID=765440 RepID=A0A0C3AN35_PILCF|nr:hypothetical protein PILCRDRAFT_681181 [Piloderma croceum F 1598]